MTRARYGALAAALVSGSVAAGVPLAFGGPDAGDTPSGERRAAERPKPDARRISIKLEDRQLMASPGRVAAGRVVLEQENHGSSAHDVLLVRTGVAADRLPVGLTGVRPELAGRVVFGALQSHHSEPAPGSADTRGGHQGHRHVGVGGRRTSSLVLRPGRYVVLCPLPGHYEAGQRTTLVVE